MDTSDSANPLQPIADRRLAGLDGLRAIAVVMVLINNRALPIPPRLWWIFNYLGNGQLGVFIFFVLSGFLITHLLMGERARTGRISLGRFYVRRMLRIFPALYTYLTVVAVLAGIGWVSTTRAEWLAAATFLTNYSFLFNRPSGAGYWFVGHFWTLSLEEQFYLLWPLAMLLMGNRRAAFLAAGIVIVSPAIRVASYQVWPESRPHLGMMLHCAGDSLMIGCLAALLEGNPLLRQAVRHRWAPTAAYAAMFFVGFVSPTLDHRFRGAYDITIGMTINGLLIAGVLIYITRNPQTRLVRFLELPWMRTIGAMSYSLYLWQQLFLGEADWRWSSFPLSIVAAALTATASNLIVERPFLRMRKRFAPNARAPKSEHLPAAAQA